MQKLGRYNKISSNVLFEAETLLVDISRNTKRKILISLNLTISILVSLYFFSKLLGSGLPNPSRDLILYPVIIVVNGSSAFYNIIFFHKNDKLLVYNFFAWFSILILQFVAIIFVNHTTVPTNSFLMINVFPLLAIIFNGLVINRHLALISFAIGIINLWYSAIKIGLNYIYKVNYTIQGNPIEVPITLYLTLWHLAFFMTVIIIYFEESTINRIINVIPTVIDKIRNAAQHQSTLENDNIRMATELDVAQKLQSFVLPPKKELLAIKDLEISAIMIPATEVGGDYYDVISSGDSVFFSIGDVTGHGLNSGVVMLMAQSAFTMALQTTDPSLVSILSSMNNVLYSNIRHRMNEETNMTISVMHYKNNTLKICGQHESIILCNADGKIDIINTFDLGIYIGLIDSIDHMLTEKSIPFNSGDTILLYTDGATEAMNSKNEEFGIQRLQSILQKKYNQSADDIIKSTIDEIYVWIGNSKIHDDITLLVIKKR